MNISQFNISLKDSIDLLKQFNLFKGIGVKPVGVHSDEVKKVSKSCRLKTIYDTVIKNMDYEIILIDDSIFQFSFDADIRYAFIQNPHEFISKQDFLTEFFPIDELLKLDNEELDLLINEIDENEYEQFLNEQELNKASNFIRYDASKIGYKPLIHSFSHIHIGLNESLRLPVSKIITPLKFVMFCIKNTYYNNWKSLLDKSPEFESNIFKSKSLCTSLGNDLWKENEKFELYLE